MAIERPAERLNSFLKDLIGVTPEVHPDYTHVRRIFQHNAAYMFRASRLMGLNEFEQKELALLTVREKTVVNQGVLEVVAEVFGKSVDDIRGPRRTRNLVLPRFAASHFFVNLGQLTLIETGRRLGGRDHSTISNHLNQAAYLIEEGGLFADSVMQVETMLRQRVESSSKPS